MDNDLTSRLERALLGALITEPGLVPRLEYVQPRDFADGWHRAVYMAIRSLADAAGSSAGDRIAAVARATGPHTWEEDVRELVASCPNPRHGTAYGIRLVQAALYRQLSETADVLGAQAALLGREGARVLEAGANGGSQAPEVVRHLGLVSAALRRHTAPLAPTGPAGGPARMPDQATMPTAAVQSSADPPDRPASDQELREEHVLTALLHEHRESDQILAFLPAAAFTSPDRQEIFRAIRRLRQASQPVDELTVIWELATRSDSSSPLPGNSDPALGIYASVTRLASARDDGQSPPKAGRELLSQLDRRTAADRQPARHAQPGQAPVQESPSPTAGFPAPQAPETTGPQQGREPRR